MADKIAQTVAAQELEKVGVDKRRVGRQGHQGSEERYGGTVFTGSWALHRHA